MKRILSILTVLTLTLCITACGSALNTSSTNKDSSESSQAEVSSVTSSISNNTVTPSTGTTQTPTVSSSKPVTSTPTQCSHQYSNQTTAPTCTEQGFTTHTCTKCGYAFTDTYIAAAHQFSDYKCTVCGMKDNEKLFNYLVQWILKNGTTDASYCAVKYETSGGSFAINYSANDKNIYLIHSQPMYKDETYHFFTGVIIDGIKTSYEYGSSLTCVSEDWIAYDISGYIQSNTFNSNTPLAYDSYESDIGNTDYSNVELARNTIVKILEATEHLLSGANGQYTNSGLTLSDLGFTAF